MKNFSLIASLCACFVVASAVQAHADEVSDRVLLITGAPGCSGGSGFKRVIQSPDGGETYETGEFQVPYGKYLVITSIEYTTPYWTTWAKWYVQNISVGIRKRSGTGNSASVFNAQYQNQSTYMQDANDELQSTKQSISQGARTEVATFPDGPLMSPNGRLCLTVSDNNFWTFGGTMRVRGHLINSGSTSTIPPNGGILLGQ